MESSLRNTPALITKIEKLRDDLIKHFEAIVGHAGMDKTNRDTTAITQYQMQVETAALIRAAEEFQVLIRQLQEMWLFGQLNTVGESKVQQQTDENAKMVADLLKELVERQSSSAGEVANGTMEKETAEEVISNGS